MPASITLEKDGKAARFSRVWVHMKRQCRLEPFSYRVTVPVHDLRLIFDPHDTKPETQSWSEFIGERVEEFGTFMLSGYFKSMARIVGDEEMRFEWVIATLDRVVEKLDYIELIGQAERFDPSRF